MKRSISHLTIATACLGASLSALGGCPLGLPVIDGAAFSLSPGAYYVEQHDGRLCYYELAAVRGAEGEWVELNEDGAWFTSPGLYVLSEDYVWSRDQNAAELTLDDFIQLHDPRPAPGSAP
jgi:hypothetical protein